MSAALRVWQVVASLDESSILPQCSQFLLPAHSYELPALVSVQFHVSAVFFRFHGKHREAPVVAHQMGGG